MENARVEQRTDLDKLTDSRLAAGAGKRQASIGNAVFSRQSDQRLGNATQLLGLWHCGLDDLVFNERRRHIAKHRPAMRTCAI